MTGFEEAILSLVLFIILAMLILGIMAFISRGEQ